MLIVVLSSSCTFSKMGSLDWVEGTWKSTEKGVNQGEIWKKVSGGYHGRAWSVQANDTIWSEDMRIVQEGDSLLLEVIHPSETEGKPVYFKEIYTSSEKFTFENRAYDWPHFITYWVEPNGQMKAHVGSYANDGGDLWFQWKKMD